MHDGVPRLQHAPTLMLRDITGESVHRAATTMHTYAQQLLYCVSAQRTAMQPRETAQRPSANSQGLLCCESCNTQGYGIIQLDCCSLNHHLWQDAGCHYATESVSAPCSERPWPSSVGCAAQSNGPGRSQATGIQRLASNDSRGCCSRSKKLERQALLCALNGSGNVARRRSLARHMQVAVSGQSCVDCYGMLARGTAAVQTSVSMGARVFKPAARIALAPHNLRLRD
jgi:hypothetical protein